MVKPNVRRVSSCEGKTRFGTFTLAARTARRQAQKRDNKFSAYPCHFCGGFHVGTHIGKSDSVTGASDSRYRYIVFVRNQAGSEFVFGWANVPDGGRVAEIARETPGLILSRIAPRRSRT